MTCEAYRAILDQLLDGVISPEDEEKLLQHEAECPACAELHASLEALQEDLSGLKDDVPSLPEGFHAGWAQKLEETPMEKQPERTYRISASLRRVLAACAILVILIGGTMLSRDRLPARTAPYSADGSAADVEYAKYSVPTANMSVMSRGAGEMPMELEEAEEDVAYAETAQDSSVPASGSQKIIRTANITLATKTFDETLSRLGSLCDSAGGWISYSSTYTGSNGLRHASLTLRIPTSAYASFLSSAQGTARVTRSEETAEDVTASYRDTSMRLDTQLALMERLQGMVTETASLSDLLELEQQIAQVQYQIDSLRSSLKHMDNSVDYSTVSISVNEEKASDDAGNTTLSFSQRISSAFHAGLAAFVDFLEDMIIFVTGALPFILIVAAVALILFLIFRKKHPRT